MDYRNNQPSLPPSPRNTHADTHTHICKQAQSLFDAFPKLFLVLGLRIILKNNKIPKNIQKGVFFHVIQTNPLG